MTTMPRKTTAAQRHQEGLRLALEILSGQEPTAAYYTLLRLEGAGQLDTRLALHARALTKADACTTSRLEMSRVDLANLLRCMTYAMEQLFGGMFISEAIDDEGEMGRLGDFAHALAVVADQAAGAAFHYTLPAPASPPPTPQTPAA
jgi:hypothetical protein